jgi:hypothetical protein
MKNVEEQLYMKKVDINNLEVPCELEDRLRNALNSVENIKREPVNKKPWLMRHKGIAAALAFLIFLSIYNYDVLAYYGKKIMGYDEITYGNFKELNEMGMGQEINKSYKYKNGAEVFVDGVMIDENKLIVMYRIVADDDNKFYEMLPPRLNGVVSKCQYMGGQGQENEEGTEVRWIGEFKPPFILDRYLSFSITSTSRDESNGETAEITFKLDMNKAIKSEVEAHLNESVEVQGIKYNFTTISATPMSVLLEGNIQVASDTDRSLFTGSVDDLSAFISKRRDLRVELWETYVADGKEVTERIQEEGGGGGSNGNEITFMYEFSGLKSNLKKLILKAVKTEDIRFIDSSISINTETSNVRVIPETEELIIKEVREENGDTVVTFNVEKDVAFVMGLFVGDKQAEEISSDSKIITVDGAEIAEKTYKFKGYGNAMRLMFKTIAHETNINDEFIIYEEK